MAVTIRGNSNVVLQVVTATATGAGTTFPYNTWTSVGLTATITPTSTTSTILILVYGSVYGVANAYGNATLYRNGANVTANSIGLNNVYAGSSNYYQNIGFEYVDSPASTSAQTYTLYCKNGNNTAAMEWLPGPSIGRITLMEIAG